MSEFFGHFREIFRRPPGRYFVIPLMFFDPWKVPGPSQNDPGSIWGTSFFDKKNLKNWPYVNDFTPLKLPPESIDLGIAMWNPH